ncbi:MAG: alpha-amylase family glycosyl hydrolase [Pseudonocardiaceae bacterium]
MKWWQKAVFYQIYPRSFVDGNGDGTGDLQGIVSHLDYLSDMLGVNAIWLSPVYPSPMVDNGYDVSDYYGVDPLFGSLQDFDLLVEQVHARGLHILMDWIPNHTSDRHRWFQEARRSRGDPRRDWYVWRDSAPDGGPPNNWRSFFPRNGSAWTLDPATSQWYLHSFLQNQPDLNWDNPAVEAAMQDTLRFWLRRGVDGFRVDALPLIGKDAGLRPNPDPEKAWGPYNIDWPSVHERLRGLRKVCQSYGDRILVGEVNVLDMERLSRYLASGDELHLAHNFLFLQEEWTAAAVQAFIDRVEHALAAPVLPSWYLGNHDNSRVVTRLGGGPQGAARARIAAVLLLTARGAPFIYQGEELGLTDSAVPAQFLMDVDGREPQRVPMPWRPPSSTVGGGFTTGSPWLPLHDRAESLNVAAQLTDETSMLSLYRRLLRYRAETSALREGEYQSLLGPDGTIAYLRQTLRERVLVVLNMTSATASVALEGQVGEVRGDLVLSTDARRLPVPVNLNNIQLSADEGLILALPTRSR